MTITGLEKLFKETKIQSQYKGNVGLLCHNASVDSNLNPAPILFRQIFGKRFIKLFGPQHGFSTDVQDNMVETDHTIHPFFKIPVYSLYSETRIPTDEMLEGIDHLFVDMQDAGCRIYTYIYTLTHLLEKVAGRDIEVIVLDRPNPINGETLEGNILDIKFASFVGRHPLPIRHGMTIGEVGYMHQRYWAKAQCQYSVLKMENWKRSMYYEDTRLPWLLPSPNIARPTSFLTFPGTVLYEGTNLSEGRGTTQSLEIVGHPGIEPFDFYENHLKHQLKKSGLSGVVIRPIVFVPTFQKHANTPCGGYQIHVTDNNHFEPWKVGQFLLREFYHQLGDHFQWKAPGYEYDFENLPIDLINGTDQLRKWVENNGSMEELSAFENHKEYRNRLYEIKIY